MALFIGIVNAMVGYKKRAYAKEGGYGDHIPAAENAGARKHAKANEVLCFWGVPTAAMSTPLLAYMLYMVMEGEETLSTSLRTVVIVYMVFLVFAVNYPLQRIKRL